MPRECRILPHLVADGPTQMAIDEALLESVASDTRAAVFRTYEWSEPTLSLGYFQSIAEVAPGSRWEGKPTVRRATGGGALWHDREVTYAIVIPAGHPLARPSSALYAAVHDTLAGLLRDAGVAARRRGTFARPPGPKPFLCFVDRDDDDVIVGVGDHHVKLVGSAQRRRAGVVLQHGSVLIAQSPDTPELPGLAELSPAGSEVGPERWVGAIREALPTVVGTDRRVDTLTDDERRMTDILRRDVYDNPSWTRRR